VNKRNKENKKECERVGKEGGGEKGKGGKRE
jgi:hypothetical protein